MFWKVPEIIELTSSYMSLEPGDVITTGTCGGTVVEQAVERMVIVVALGPDRAQRAFKPVRGK